MAQSPPSTFYSVERRRSSTEGSQTMAGAIATVNRSNRRRSRTLEGRPMSPDPVDVIEMMFASLGDRSYGSIEEFDAAAIRNRQRLMEFLIDYPTFDPNWTDINRRLNALRESTAYVLQQAPGLYATVRSESPSIIPRRSSPLHSFVSMRPPQPRPPPSS